MRKLNAAIYTEIALSMVQIANAPDWVKALWVEQELKARGLWRDDVFDLVRPFLVSRNKPAATETPSPKAPPAPRHRPGPFQRKAPIIEFSHSFDGAQPSEAYTQADLASIDPGPDTEFVSRRNPGDPPVDMPVEELEASHAIKAFAEYVSPVEPPIEPEAHFADETPHEQTGSVLEPLGDRTGQAEADDVEEALALASMMHMLTMATRWPQEMAAIEHVPQDYTLALPAPVLEAPSVEEDVAQVLLAEPEAVEQPEPTEQWGPVREEPSVIEWIAPDPDIEGWEDELVDDSIPEDAPLIPDEPALLEGASAPSSEISEIEEEAPATPEIEPLPAAAPTPVVRIARLERLQPRPASKLPKVTFAYGKNAVTDKITVQPVAASEEAPVEQEPVAQVAVETVAVETELTPAVELLVAEPIDNSAVRQGGEESTVSGLIVAETPAPVSKPAVARPAKPATNRKKLDEKQQPAKQAQPPRLVTAAAKPSPTPKPGPARVPVSVEARPDQERHATKAATPESNTGRPQAKVVPKPVAASKNSSPVKKTKVKVARKSAGVTAKPAKEKPRTPRRLPAAMGPERAINKVTSEKNSKTPHRVPGKKMDTRQEMPLTVFEPRKQQTQTRKRVTRKRDAQPAVPSPEISPAQAGPELAYDPPIFELEPLPDSSLEKKAPSWQFTLSSLEQAQGAAKGTQFEHIWERAAGASEKIQRRVNRWSA